MIKPAYSVSFLLSINIFVWQNVLYFPNDKETLIMQEIKRTNLIKIVLRVPSTLHSTLVSVWLGSAIGSRTELHSLIIIHVKQVQYVEPSQAHNVLASLSLSLLKFGHRQVRLHRRKQTYGIASGIMADSS